MLDVIAGDAIVEDDESLLEGEGGGGGGDGSGNVTAAAGAAAPAADGEGGEGGGGEGEPAPRELTAAEAKAAHDEFKEQVGGGGGVRSRWEGGSGGWRPTSVLSGRVRVRPATPLLCRGCPKRVGAASCERPFHPCPQTHPYPSKTNKPTKQPPNKPGNTPPTHTHRSRRR